MLDDYDDEEQKDDIPTDINMLDEINVEICKDLTRSPKKAGRGQSNILKDFNKKKSPTAENK